MSKQINIKTISLARNFVAALLIATFLAPASFLTISYATGPVKVAQAEDFGGFYDSYGDGFGYEYTLEVADVGLDFGLYNDTNYAGYDYPTIVFDTPPVAFESNWNEWYFEAPVAFSAYQADYPAFALPDSGDSLSTNQLPDSGDSFNSGILPDAGNSFAAADLPDAGDSFSAGDLPDAGDSFDYEEERSGFPWGILGVAGIVGLFASHSSRDTNTTVIAQNTNVQCPTPVITSSTVANGTVNSAFNYFVSTQSDRVVTISAGSLPSGLTFSNNTISGTPTTSGTFTVTLTVSNACGSSTQTLTIVIAAVGTPPCPVPSITSSTATNGTVNSAFNYFVSTQSDRAVSISTSGLPAGLSFSGNTISGVPTTSGTFNVTLTVSNACGTSSQNLTIVIAPVTTACPVPVITSGTSASGTVGNSFAYVVGVNSDRAVTITTSNLPAGLSFSGNTISGVPTTSGTFTVTITASNACGSDTETVTITINAVNNVCVPTPTIVSVASASGLVGYNFSHTVVANNATSVSVSGLPSGLTYSTGNNLISGVPNNAGTYSVIVTATNNCGTVTQVLTIVVNVQGQTYIPPTYYPPVNYPPVYYPPTYINPSNVYLSQTPYNGFYLSEVPYTGAGDIVLTILYTLALIIISAAIAYTSVYGNNFGPLAQMIARLKIHAARMKYGFLSFFVSGDRENEEVESEVKEEVGDSAPAIEANEGSAAFTLMKTARAEGALLNENAANFIMEVAEQNVVVASSILRQIISGKSATGKSDEFVLLSENTVRAMILESYLSLAPVYARLLKEGKVEKAEKMLLKLVKLGYDTKVFLTKVAELNEASVSLTPAYQTA